MNCHLLKGESGFTLIEIIIYIVIIGIIATGLFTSFVMINNNANKLASMNQALYCAKQRMELILGQKRMYSYANTADLCQASTPPDFCANTTPAPLCTTAGGYTVIATITNNSPLAKEKTIYVKATATKNNAQAELRTLVADY